ESRRPPLDEVSLVTHIVPGGLRYVSRSQRPWELQLAVPSVAGDGVEMGASISRRRGDDRRGVAAATVAGPVLASARAADRRAAGHQAVGTAPDRLSARAPAFDRRRVL